MRYPRTSFMKRTFDLVTNRLGLASKMLPYIRTNDSNFLSYNRISVTKATVKKAKNNSLQPASDIFKFSEKNDGHLPDKYVAEGPDAFWDQHLGHLRQLFVDYPFDEAFKKLMVFDAHTVTSYLMLEKKVPFEVVKWYELMESRTGLFDASLTETVLASLVFNDPRFKGKKVDWFCFEYVVLIITYACIDSLP